MAIKSSFKQQCPSCEAMVPIRDPKLIGRKIDCPKCKYRFIVEEPVDEVDEVDEVEEAPAKKGKSGSAAITNKKPASGKAGKAAPKRRPDDDEDEDEAPPKKKASGGSGMLIVGIGLAAIAVVALAVGAVFLFTGDGSDNKPSGSSSSNVPVGGPAEIKQKDNTQPVKDEPKPRQADVTNLLPNDTQVVLNLPLEQLFGNAKVNQALLRTPGGFHEAAFQRTWGFSPREVRRVVQAHNFQNKTVFTVMRTSDKIQVKEEDIVARLNLKPEEKGKLKYYPLPRSLDALSQFVLTGGEYHEKLALHFADRFTVVCADMAPMTQFLEEKGQPKLLSQPPVEKPQNSGQHGGPGGMPGARPGGPGGPPGGPGGRPGAPGGPPGGSPQSPPAGTRQSPPGAPQSPPAGAPQPGGAPGGNAQHPAPAGGAPGGFQPPQGMPPGMFPGGGGNTSDAPALSSSYMTIDPQLKAVLDQVEKVDKKENQNVLLSLALSTSGVSVDAVNKVLAQHGESLSKLPDGSPKMVLELFQSKLKAGAVAVTQFSDSKVILNGAVGFQDAKLAKEWEKLGETLVAGVLLQSGLDLVPKNSGRGNFPGMPQGMPGGPPGGAFPQPGQPGPGFPGMQPQDGNKKEEKGKQGDYLFWSKDNVLALGVNVNIKSDHYKTAGLVLEYFGIFLRGVTAMSDRRSHIHELAAAIQANHDKEGHFPRGAMPRSPDGLHVLGWRPDQRLSWMTQILPYLANGEFKGVKPESNKAWYEDSVNQKAGFTVIPQFVAPTRSEDITHFYVEYPNLSLDGLSSLPSTLVGWASTHFVGMAGVGLDAAEYRDGDAATAKLRGVFSYDRVTKKDDIKDGAENTIVVIQVPPVPKSPWIAGGGSTVRGVSDDLDCVRPFVCARYKNKDGKDEDGTFAIMADGKVRFIPASIDPKTFQAMCTIAGGEKIKDIDAVAPEVPPPEEPKQPELKAEQPAPVAAKPPAQPQPAKPPAKSKAAPR